MRIHIINFVILLTVFQISSSKNKHKGHVRNKNFSLEEKINKDLIDDMDKMMEIGNEIEQSTHKIQESNILYKMKKMEDEKQPIVDPFEKSFLCQFLFLDNSDIDKLIDENIQQENQDLDKKLQELSKEKSQIQSQIDLAYQKDQQIENKLEKDLGNIFDNMPLGFNNKVMGREILQPKLRGQILQTFANNNQDIKQKEKIQDQKVEDKDDFEELEKQINIVKTDKDFKEYESKLQDDYKQISNQIEAINKNDEQNDFKEYDTKVQNDLKQISNDIDNFDQQVYKDNQEFSQISNEIAQEKKEQLDETIQINNQNIKKVSNQKITQLTNQQEQYKGLSNANYFYLFLFVLILITLYSFSQQLSIQRQNQQKQSFQSLENKFD